MVSFSVFKCARTFKGPVQYCSIRTKMHQNAPSASSRKLVHACAIERLLFDLQKIVCYMFTSMPGTTKTVILPWILI